MSGFVVFNHDDEKWVSGIRKNAVQLNRDKGCAVVFPTIDCAVHFLAVLKVLYPDLFFQVLELY